MNLLAIDRDLPRCFDAELDAARRDGEHRDAHFAGNDDGLVETPGENQHVSSLCFHSGSSARSVHAPIMGAKASSTIRSAPGIGAGHEGTAQSRTPYAVYRSGGGENASRPDSTRAGGAI